MKKLLLLLAAVLVIIPAFAEKYVLVSDISQLTADKQMLFVGSKNGTYYAMGSQNTNNRKAVEVTVEDGVITTLPDGVQVITLEGTTGAWNFNVGDGYLYAASSSSNQLKTEASVDANGNANAAITISAGTTSVVFQGTNSRKYLQYNSSSTLFACYSSASQAAVSIYIEESDEPAAVAKPTFSPAAGIVDAGTEVTIACETDGAAIYYTTDGTEPTASSTAYTAAVVINETTTLKAVAVKGEDSSAVATATYTVIPASTLAEVIAMAKGDTFKMGDKLTVTYVNGAYNYVVDAAGTTFGLVYQYDLGLNAGDVIAAGWLGTVDIYSGLVEMKPSDALATDGTVEVPACAEVATTAALEALPVNSIAVIKNVTFAEATISKVANFTGTFDGSTVTFRNTFSLASTPAGDYDVKVAVSCYNTTNQYLPISYTALEEVVFAPVFSIADGAKVVKGTELTITCETEGAVIYYTTDGAEPTAASTVYTAPIAINEDVTVKAVAIKNAVSSEVTVASYTVANENEVEFTGWPTLFGVEQDGSLAVTANSVDWTATVNDITLNVKNGTSTNSYLKAEDFRVYKGYTLTFTAATGYMMTSIETVAGGKNFATDAVSADSGNVNIEKGNVSWTGKATSVAFTITATGSFKTITVTKAVDDGSSAIEAVEVEAGEAQYYNLQGVRVANPQGGIFIRVQGGKASKVIM